MNYRKTEILDMTMYMHADYMLQMTAENIANFIEIMPILQIRLS